MTFRVSRISAAEAQAIAGPNGIRLKGFLDRMAGQVETQVNDILTAQETATAAAREAARINSYTNPGGVLSAADAGSNVTITMAPHIRVYPVQGMIDVADVSLTGGTITGQPYSTRVYAYYDDTTLANVAPTLHATTTAATAQVGAAVGRHCLGYIDTPASGGGATTGGGTSVPGGGGGRTVDGTQLP